MTASSRKKQAQSQAKNNHTSITEAFGADLAVLLSKKIVDVHPAFPARAFVRAAATQVVGKTYTERVEIIADLLHRFLPQAYPDALRVLMGTLGPENKAETGMFTHFYWLIPVGKFVEKYGLDHFTLSMKALGEITKRNTGEYAIRPYARKYPHKTLAVCQKWARSTNFHLRRLASEGLRPKLPWATKLDTWNTNPQPIFDLLDILKEDDVKFVQKSVANHIRDWTKVNPTAAKKVLDRWSRSKNAHTAWIVKRARR